MRQRISQAGRSFGLHVRRQAVGYAALVVALGGSAYAGTKANSGKVGGKDLRPFVERDGNAGHDSGAARLVSRRRSASGESGRSLRSGREAARVPMAPCCTHSRPSGLPKRQGFFSPF